MKNATFPHIDFRAHWIQGRDFDELVIDESVTTDGATHVLFDYDEDMAYEMSHSQFVALVESARAADAELRGANPHMEFRADALVMCPDQAQRVWNHHMAVVSKATG